MVHSVEINDPFLRAKYHRHKASFYRNEERNHPSSCCCYFQFTSINYVFCCNCCCRCCLCHLIWLGKELVTHLSCFRDRNGGDTPSGESTKKFVGTVFFWEPNFSALFFGLSKSQTTTVISIQKELQKCPKKWVSKFSQITDTARERITKNEYQS